MAAWLAPYAAARVRVLAAQRAGHALVDALNLARDADTPVRFVPHESLPGGEAYEAFIARTGCVPTRDNLHDLFNALVWLTFPAIKRRLNELQVAEIARDGIGSTRGAVRDALTVFDENGAWWDAPAVLRDALEARDWHALFIRHRDAWAQSQPVLFGHALLEKLEHPRKAITAHVLLVDPQALPRLSPEQLAAKPYAPLPVLGVPGWWAPNASAAFYDDPAVFRASRGGHPS